MENDILEIVTFLDKICWSFNMVRKDAQMKLKRKCQVINMCILFVLLLLLSTLTINAPCFGSQREVFIFIQIFEEYFGEWSFIPYYFYFTAFPFLYYNFLKLWMSFVYMVLEAQLQFILVEEFLFETNQVNRLKGWKYLHDTGYQKKIEKSLRLCIIHHNALKKYVRMTLNVTLKAMPFFLILGILLLISMFAFLINFADTITTMSNILKMRIIMTVTVTMCIAALLCWLGQQLIDTTSDIFASLVGAPWYFWNLGNIRILLMFLTNCTKNESVVLAGICVDYKLLVSVRTSSTGLLIFRFYFRCYEPLFHMLWFYLTFGKVVLFKSEIR
nr:PREDICTED: uncharacterized protein LOC107397676 [Tribolium castaneum]|eukprot:XP_015834087.1 PREDICTED: uncharacterized protein LOC107397676 [Tribolium castaneum]